MVKDQDKVQLLLDRMEISDTVVRYATAVDTRDWKLYRSCFTDEVELDFAGWAVGTHNADEWVDMVRQMLGGFTATQHISSNHVIKLNGNEATCLSYVQAQHYLPNDTGDSALTIGGHYKNDLIRTEGGWKISKCRLKITWYAGNRYVFELARMRLAESEQK
jgi:hypothetical protein